MWNVLIPKALDWRNICPTKKKSLNKHIMILIAHRGNTTGPNPARENTVAYIQEALDKLEVEGIIERTVDGYIMLDPNPLNGKGRS